MDKPTPRRGLTQRLATRWRLWRRQRYLRSQGYDAPLREFIYLDEVSVYSLLSSKLGALTAEITQAQSRSAKDEAGASIGLTPAPGFQFGITGKQELTQTASTQVLRKASIQTTFKELYEYERDNFALRILSEDEVEVVAQLTRTRPHDLGSLLETDVMRGAYLRLSEITRGVPIELRVTLDTDESYRLSQTFYTFEQLVATNPTLFSELLTESFRQAAGINRVLEHLMAGLIPLKCELVDYRVVRVGAESYLIHQSILEYFPDAQAAAQPVKLVGVTEQNLYWRDVRRALFSRQEYRVMARITSAGLKRTWTPMKVVDAMSDAVPGLARQLNEGARAGLAQMRSGAEVETAQPSPEYSAARAAIELFSQEVATRRGLTYDAKVLDSEGLVSSEALVEFGNIDVRRGLFERAAALFPSSDGAVDSSELRSLRTAALADAGFDPTGALVEKPEPTKIHPEDSDEQLLEAEIVAIYW